MGGRPDELLDAAIRVVGQGGLRALTHRAVDAAAGLPLGSTSNYWRTSGALLTAVIDRFVQRERANWEQIAQRVDPSGPAELARALGEFARDAAGPQRELTVTRHALLVEAAIRPALQAPLSIAGGQVRGYFRQWLRQAGSGDVERDFTILGNFVVGLVLHQLAYPDPDWDPAARCGELIQQLIPACQPGPAPPRSTP